MTFSGSLVAFGKLQGIMKSKPLQYVGRDTVNAGLAAGSVVGLGAMLADSANADTGTLALSSSAAMATVLGWQLTAGVVSDSHWHVLSMATLACLRHSKSSTRSAPV